MYAVIFKAIAGEQDQYYSDMVATMRDLAFSKYNCIDFIAVTEGYQEIAISYWHSEEDIKRWHLDAKHQVAQQLGREKWYQAYTIEVLEVKRQYHFPAN